MTDIILKNKHGVMILESGRSPGGHYRAHNAVCCCGAELLVSPPICHPDHKKGDPVMACGDHFIHAYRFSELHPGRQTYFGDGGPDNDR